MANIHLHFLLCCHYLKLICFVLFSSTRVLNIKVRPHLPLFSEFSWAKSSNVSSNPQQREYLMTHVDSLWWPVRKWHTLLIIDSGHFLPTKCLQMSVM